MIRMKIRFVNFDPSRLADLKYEVRAVPGGSGLSNKAGILATMKELLTAGAIDFKTFLEMTELPNKGRMLQRIEEQEAIQQQLEERETLLAEEQALAGGVPVAQPAPQPQV